MKAAGYTFDTEPADVDEDNFPAMILPSELARKLAEAKASTIALRNPSDVIVGSDTVVAFGDEILGKPKDETDARRMLQLLSGTTHIVITGVCVMCIELNKQRVDRAMSCVRMNVMKPHEIDAYIATKDWEGKAGGYGIQDKDPFVTRLTGDHTNIVGLPMGLVGEMLAEVGIFPNEGPDRDLGSPVTAPFNPKPPTLPDIRLQF